MIELSAAEVAEAVEGRLVGVVDPHAATVAAADTDSRAMAPGALFIAKPGETTDGHLFIAEALAAGAVLALAERETAAEDGTPHPAVIVDDVVAAMARLAAEVVRRIRAHSPTTVIGITGSAGKTTTKDLLRGILEVEGPTVAPQGSYNSEVGVPLTVFTAALDTRFLVVEMGADAPGNIRDLAAIVEPDVGVVLMVGSAHAGKFGGAEKIAAVKQELVEAVGGEGTVILNDDDPQVRAMADAARAPVAWITADSMDVAPRAVAAQQVMLDDDGRPQLTLAFGAELVDPDEPRAVELTSGLIGAHHVTNLLAAAAAAAVAGVGPAAIGERLHGRGASSRWRMERTERADGVTILNDAYNASPESMREALRTLAMISRSAGRRSVAVLGAMLELGDESIARHAQLGETVVRLDISRVLVVGEEAYPLYRSAIAEGSWGAEVRWAATADEAEELLADELRTGDVVLFKSSHGAGLRLLGDRVAGRPGDALDGSGKAGTTW